MKYGDMTIQSEATIRPFRTTMRFQRDMSLASGLQSVTAVGFRPSVIIFIASVQNSNKFSIGATDNASGAWFVASEYAITPGDWESSTAGAEIEANIGVGISYRGDLQSFDSDGFTVNWTKQGASTGTLDIYFIAFK